MKLLGHRGYSERYVENSLKAFRACKEFDGVELDLQLCKTKEVVIIHDFDLKRLANLDKKVKDLTLDELKTLKLSTPKAKESESLITLEELFDDLSNTLYYDLELKEETAKDTGLARAVFQIIKNYKMEKNVLVSSFNPFTLRRFNRLSKGKIDSAIIFSNEDGPWILRRGFGRFIAKSNMLKPDRKQIDKAFMKKFSKKYKILTWTVIDIDDAKRLIDLGVDGLICNDPGKFKDLINKN